MLEVDRPPDRSGPGVPASSTAVPRRVAVPVLCVAFGLLAFRVPPLWSEWRGLRTEWDRTRDRAIVGYIDIHPRYSGADPPREWYRERADAAYLWAGWAPRVGHRWFRVSKGEVPQARLTGVYGRDVIPAIDVPLTETDGGLRWRRIPPRSKVVGLDLNGQPSAYPILLMEKVEVVNDELWGHPFLLAYSPANDPSSPVEIFAPILDGKRVTMGLAGYFLDHHPLLYDRGTQSLWVRRPEGLAAVAGPLKGAVLPRIAKPTLVTWQDWRADHPNGRLIIGADRSKGLPAR